MDSRQILHSVGSGGGGGGGDGGVVVAGGEGVEIVAHDGGVGFAHLQHLLLWISEHKVHVCTLVPTLPGGFALDHTNRKPEYN